MLPNHSNANAKIYRSNFEYNLFNKHVEYYDQQMGARHPSLYNKEFRVMKTCTITLIYMMALVLTALVMLTLSMGTMIFESIIAGHYSAGAL